MKWTKEQEKAVYEKGSNILVAAAAGSGKTAVLVERIIQKIINDEIDIDKLLVVTFTNAAASEMRERVLEAIYKKLDENPENDHLQKQIALLGKSNICTIHAFCLEVLKNYFYEINLPANFRIGAEEEIEILKQEVIEELFDELYESNDGNFINLVKSYTSYRGDDELKELILKIYSYIQSSPFPFEWLNSKTEMFNEINFINEDGSYKDFLNSIWGKIIVKDVREDIEAGINNLKIIKSKLEKYAELEKYTKVIISDIDKLEYCYKSTTVSWDTAFGVFENFKFDNWPVDRKISLDVKDEAKNLRDKVKKGILTKFKNVFLYNSEEAYKDLSSVYENLKNIENIILQFDKNFKKKKLEKNIIDFNDIEHNALKILVKKDDNGNNIPTDVALKYRSKFEEIAIDEYQDSNEVQEFILNVISRGNNIFMVGDVKQSIYKFRQACPDLFLHKYEIYKNVFDEVKPTSGVTETNYENGRKIQLFKNFRSRENILTLTNTVFKNIMSKTLGDIDYTEEEFLNLGADFEEVSNGLSNSEMNIINLKSLNNKESDTDEENSENEENILEKLGIKNNADKNEIEAKYVAQRIEDLINSKVQVKDKKLGYRDITYKDIVILFRAPSKVAPIFEKELLRRNIPVFSDVSINFLDTFEIQIMMNLLKVLDNPMDDISLVSVMRSEIGNFTDNEILEIRLINKEVSFYESINQYLNEKNTSNSLLYEKLNNFKKKIELWQEESYFLNLSELIWKIFSETGFLNYVGLMPNGALRQANLKMLFEKAKDYEKTSFSGLFSFIGFMERLHQKNSDMSSAKIIGENENVVRIMSIHKSKGLEFPVVFLSNASKKANMQDLNGDVLLHQKIGLGPKYINYDRRISYSTTARESIKILSKTEAISEEMRVFYVALTRAKEKLIITGTCRDYEKDIEGKKEILKSYGEKVNSKVSEILLKKYTSYIDWLELGVTLNENFADILPVNVVEPKELIKEEDDVASSKEIQFDFNEFKDFNEVDEMLEFEYPNKSSIELPIKTTVSKILMGNKIQNSLEVIPVNFECANEANLNESNENISPTRIGTITHDFLKRLDYKLNYSLEDLEKLKESLVLKNIFTEKEVNTISLQKVDNFLKSDLVKELKEAVIIEKEKPFCMKMEENDVLVQGIIDLYAVDKNNNILLVDFKTDKINEKEKFIENYKKQLELYKEALESATNKKVTEVYIYSLHLSMPIKVNF